MASTLLRPSTWRNRKPSANARIDWSHPLAQGLFVCVLFNEYGGKPRELISGLADSVSTTSRWTTDGLYVNGAAGDSVGWALPTGSQWTGPLTCATRFAHTASGGTTQIYATRSPTGTGTANTPVMVFRSGTTNTLGARRRGASAGSATYFVSGLDPRATLGKWWDVIVTHPTGQANATPTFIVDGAVQTTSLSGSAVSEAVTVDSSAFRVGDRITSAPLTGYVGYTYLWSRALSTAEAQWLQAEPYAFIVPAAPRIFYIVPRGTVTISGTGALSGSSGSLSGAGTETISGAGALTGAAGALAGSGTETIGGTAGLTGSSGTLGATGTETIGGTGGLTGAATALAGTGTETIGATAALLGAAGILAGIGTETIAGTGALAGSAGALAGVGVQGTLAPRGVVTLEDTTARGTITVADTTSRGRITVHDAAARGTITVE